MFRTVGVALGLLSLGQRAQGQAVDTTGSDLMLPCDTTADSTIGWKTVRASTFRLRFTMRVPPEMENTFSISSGSMSTGEYRKGDHTITWLMAGASGGAFSTSGVERRHRCYLSIGPPIVQYSSARRADLYFAWALWTWKGENRGRSLFMYA